jgi:hypothetical protein
VKPKSILHSRTTFYCGFTGTEANPENVEIPIYQKVGLPIRDDVSGMV